MNKKMLGMFAGIFALLMFASFGSAYYYYDDYSYSSARSYGSSYGRSYTRAVDYDKSTTTRYLPYGGYEKVTSYYKKEIVDRTPTYRYGYNYYYDSGWYEKYWTYDYGNSYYNYYNRPYYYRSYYYGW